LVKRIARISSQGFQGNLFHIFSEFSLFSMYFRILNEFLKFLFEKGKSEKKSMNSVGPLTAQGAGARPGPATQGGLEGPATRHDMARAHAHCSHRGQSEHSGTTTDGGRGAPVYIFWRHEHRGGIGEASGKLLAMGAHR
jgi:hypothetical protein